MNSSELAAGSVGRQWRGRMCAAAGSLCLKQMASRGPFSLAVGFEVVAECKIHSPERQKL